MPPAARIWFAVTALLAGTGVAIEVVLVIDRDPRFATDAARIANLLTYFTIQSNLLVGAASALLAVRARATTWLAAVCVAALLAISITAIVFHVALAPRIGPLSGPTAVANALLHTIVPLAFVAGWVALGPRGVFRLRTVLWSLCFPLGWLALTLTRGALSGYYPYPFLDVAETGHTRMLANVGGILVAYVAIALVLAGVDRVLRDRGPEHASPAVRTSRNAAPADAGTPFTHGDSP